MGAERVALAAERAGRKIAVEIQSFLSRSPLHDLHDAVGQYVVYRTVLAETQPDRQVYLAVPRHVYEGLLSERFGNLIMERLQIALLVFDDQQRRIVTWID